MSVGRLTVGMRMCDEDSIDTTQSVLGKPLHSSRLEALATVNEDSAGDDELDLHNRRIVWMTMRTHSSNVRHAVELMQKCCAGP